MKISSILNSCVAAALLVPVSAYAATPAEIADLVGARAAGGESAMESRGYVNIKTEKGDDRSWEYWWQQARKQCVTIAVVDGRFDAITATSPVDCNHKPSSGGSGAAAAGIAAAAIIGAIALSHKSHHHDTGTHYDDAASEAAYERGYRDGLYHQSYHNYDRSDAYSSGYAAGVEQRGRETSYRNDHRGGAGYRPSVDVSDLEGARGSSADSEMRRRGFSDVDGLKSGNTSYTIWYNGRTRQCLQMGVADGRVVNLTDIGSAPKCR